MPLIQQIAFILLSGAAIRLFAIKILRIRKNILLGKEEDFSDHPALRWKNLLSWLSARKKCSGIHWLPYCIFLSMPDLSSSIWKCWKFFWMVFWEHIDCFPARWVSLYPADQCI